MTTARRWAWASALVLATVGDANAIKIITTASNSPPAQLGQPVRIAGSARYDSPSIEVKGGRTTIVLAGVTATTVTDAVGTYATNMPPLAVGTYTARVCVTDFSITGCTGVVFTVTSTQSSQTISFPAMGDQQPTNKIGLAATASSGLPVAFAVGSGPASIAGGTNLTFTGAGAVSIVASQPGDAAWNPAPNVTNTFLVIKFNQTIAFPLIADQHATNKVGLAATASSGLPVTFSVGSGPASIAGGTNLSFTATGTVRIVASQTGDASWNPAPNVTNTFQVTKFDQTITFPPIADQVTTNRVFVNPIASSGLAVSYSMSGPAYVWGGGFIAFSGTGTVSLVAFQDGDSAWNPAPRVTNTFAVFPAKIDQTISFPAISDQVVTSRIGLAATASSGLPVTFSVDSGPASIASGTNLTFSATGTVRIVASQTGDANWNPALNVTNTFQVNRLDQTITFPPIADQLTTNHTFLSASASSGLPMTYFMAGTVAYFTGGTGVRYMSSGVVSIVAYQEGDATWKPSPRLTNTFTVYKVGQTINFPAIPDQAATSRVGLAATAYSGLPVTFAVGSGPAAIADGTNLTFTSAGTVRIIASQAGNALWHAAPIVTNTITVTTGKADQTITFPPIGNKTPSDTVGLAATASSGLPVTFAVGSGQAVISDGTNLSFTGEGPVSIVASQPGDATWNAAPDVINSFGVMSVTPATVTLSNLEHLFDGTMKTATVTTLPPELTVTVTYDGMPFPPTIPGVYAVDATVINPGYTGSASGTLIIHALAPPHDVFVAPPMTHPATRLDLMWQQSQGLPVLITVAPEFPMGFPNAGTIYADNDTFGNQTVVRGSAPAPFVQATGLLPGQHYYVTFYAVNNAQYSFGTQSNLIMGLPKVRNAGGGLPGAPMDVYLGDTSAVFSCDAWGLLESNEGRARVVVSSSPDLQSFPMNGPWSMFTSSESKIATWEGIFHSTGPMYWGMQLDYGFPYVSNFWYNQNSELWMDAWPAPAWSFLTVNVLPIVAPLGLSALSDPVSPHSQMQLSWTRNPRSNNVMVVRRPAGTPRVDPTQPTHLMVGMALGDGTVVYHGDIPSFTDINLTPDTSYEYAVYSVNNDFYSDGVDLSAATAPCAPDVPTGFSFQSSSTSFTAQWTAVPGATQYRVDVSPHPDFSVAPVVSTIFRETMGAAPAPISVNDHEAADGFDRDDLTMRGHRSPEPTDVRSDAPSTGYIDPDGNPASGGANVFFDSTGVRAFDITGIDATGYDELRLNFGFKSESGGGGVVLYVVWSLDDGLFQHMIIQPPFHEGMPPDAFNTDWHMATNLLLPATACQTNLMLRWIKHWTTGMRIDDVVLQGANHPDPYVPGYQDLVVTDPGVVVTGLQENTTYYFRVRAEGAPGGCLSAHSITTSVSTFSLAGTTYVAPSGGHIPPFTSWVNAATNIQEAMNATAPGGLVLVSNGVYDTGGAAAPGSTVNNRVLVGPGIRLESVNGPEHTVIVGAEENLYQGLWPTRGVYLSTGATVVGFTITNGYARGAAMPGSSDGSGGGVYAETNGTAENCVISGCTAGAGGGAAEANLVDCRLIGNTAIDMGGGAYRGTLLRCRVEDNVASSVGGGIANHALAELCWIEGNRATMDGGGVYGGSYFGGITRHCVIIDNEAQTGGGVSGDNTFLIDVRNCTIVGNRALSSGGGYQFASVYDSIVYYNTAPTAPNYHNLPAGPMITAEDGPFVLSTNAPGIISLANPRLLASSIAIDADNDPTMPALDIDGEVRPQGAAEDLGADEFNAAALTGPLSVQITAASPSVLAGQPLQFDIAVVGQPIGYTADLDDGSSVSDQLTFTHVYAATGTYDVVVTASNNSGSVSATTTVTVLESGAAITYVSLTGSHTPPFSSWASAATNIQTAVDSSSVGGLVLVANGVYETGSRVAGGGPPNRVVIDKNVRVESENGPAAAIIRGAWSGPGTNAVRAVYLGAGASLAGFTIEWGALDTDGMGPPAVQTAGAGIYAASPVHSVSNCVIRNSRAFLGAGVAFANLVYCRVESNAATYGGGAYGGTIDRCDIVNNTAGMEGGGALSPSSITRSRISGNVAGWAGGGLVSADNVLGCIISGNWSRRAGGALNSTLRRCTVSGNTAQNFAGGLQGGSAVDSIVYHNKTTVSANHVATGLENCYTDPAPAGNFSADPMLVSPVNGHLLPGSPCIDTGRPSGLGTDLDGDAGPAGAAEDLGADEYNAAAPAGALGVTLSASAAQVLAGHALTFNMEVTGLPSGISLDLGDGHIAAGQSIVTHAYDAAGTYLVVAIATNASSSASDSVAVTVLTANASFYVAPGGGHVPPFATWTDAATTIQAAVDIAPQGAVVWVSNGVYVSGGRLYPGTALSNVVIATNGVSIRSVNGPGVTFIGGTNQVMARGVFLGAGSSLEGFTVRNFTSRPPGSDFDLEMSGGGIYCLGPDIYVRNCIIQGNRAETWGGGVRGGIIEDSHIVSNTAGYAVIGGGGGADGSTLRRCRIAHNEATAGQPGGGISGSAAYDSIIEYNKASGGGAGAAHSTAERCIVRSNQGSGTHGAGSLVRSSLIHGNAGAGCSYGYIINSTVVGNQGGGVWSANVTNSILHGNTPSNHYSLIRIHNSCTTPMPQSSFASNNIDADPAFMNAAAMDFRLASNSPCINAGTNAEWMTDATDLDGNPRVQQGTVDMGAYEYPSYNSNGVLRAWLRSQGLPDDGTADDVDFDEDGFDTLNEWVAGTDARDASSALVFGSGGALPEVTGEGVVLRWPSAEGRTYRISCSKNLAVGFDEIIATGIAATPPANSFTIPDPVPEGASYRVEVE